MNLPYRGACPKCGGDNSFSAERVDGYVLYHCFRASCELSGKVKKDYELRELREIGKRLTTRSIGPGVVPVFTIPEHFSRNVDLEFVSRLGIMDAYADGRVDLRYDSKLNRLVFLLKDKGECYGAVGRAIGIYSKPKWFVYGSLDFPFTAISIGSDSGPSRFRTRILVEDCISACKCSAVCNSVALLGTNLLASHIPFLDGPLIIALDKDASKKAIEMQRRLSFYIDSVKVLLLERDLKYETTETIKRMICSIS